MAQTFRSDAAEAIKEALTADQVARHYGFTPDRAGFIQCPFHKGDRHGSLKLYPGRKGWHCFGCNRGGSVIDFAMELFGLSFPQAVVRLSADFRLGIAPGRISRVEASEILERRRREREARERLEAEYWSWADEFRYWWTVQKYYRPDESMYAAAVKRLPYLEYRLDLIEEELVR